MRRLMLLVFILFILVSCKDDDEVAFVSIRNETNYTINIEFFPAKNANGFRLQETLDTLYKNQVDVYHSGDQSVDPCDLLATGYDSIVVAIQNPTSDSIFFGKGSAFNYQINPFRDSDKWIYEEYYRNFPDNGSLNTTLIHDYILVIREDLVTNKK